MLRKIGSIPPFPGKSTTHVFVLLYAQKINPSNFPGEQKNLWKTVSNHYLPSIVLGKMPPYLAKLKQEDLIFNFFNCSDMTLRTLYSLYNGDDKRC